MADSVVSEYQEQRRHYEVAIYHGKLFYKVSGELVHTGSAKNDRWIFVLSPSDRLYIGRVCYPVCNGSYFPKCYAQEVDTCFAPHRIFDNSDSLTVQKQPGVIQHSSFLAGGATVAAGRLVVEHGILKVRCQSL